MGEYQIFTDATADINKLMLEGLPNLKIIPMNIEIMNKEYSYSPNGNITCKEFYDLQRKGNFVNTSQINSTIYNSYFEPILKEGKDIIYLSFSSGMSGTYQSSCISRDELKEIYPDRNIICIDTLCASVGEGLIVIEALKKQANGLDIFELKEWIEKNKLNVCHWFTVDVFDHLKHGGRVNAVSAKIGSTLNIKPMLNVNSEGKLQVVKKIHGKNKVILEQLEKMKNSWDPKLGNTVIIGHGDDLETAEKLKNKIEKTFSNIEVYISDIGPIIGAHTGPGILVLTFWGNNR